MTIGSIQFMLLLVEFMIKMFLFKDIKIDIYLIYEYHFKTSYKTEGVV